MKTALTMLLLVLISSEALAIQRYTSTSMSCAKIQAAIRADGAAIMRYSSKSGVPLYGRYVSDVRYCDRGQILDRESIPASDTRNCRVMRCRESDFDVPSR